MLITMPSYIFMYIIGWTLLCFTEGSSLYVRSSDLYAIVKCIKLFNSSQIYFSTIITWLAIAATVTSAPKINVVTIFELNYTIQCSKTI